MVSVRAVKKLQDASKYNYNAVREGRPEEASNSLDIIRADLKNVKHNLLVYNKFAVQGFCLERTVQCGKLLWYKLKTGINFSLRPQRSVKFQSSTVDRFIYKHTNYLRQSKQGCGRQIVWWV